MNKTSEHDIRASEMNVFDKESRLDLGSVCYVVASAFVATPIAVLVQGRPQEHTETGLHLTPFVLSVKHSGVHARFKASLASRTEQHQAPDALH